MTTEPAAPFQDPVTNETGTGCMVTITGTGADFAETATLGDINNALSVVLQSAGWDIDPAYTADSAADNAFAVRQGDLLALVNVSVEPSPEANCPADQPLSACDADPSLMNYTISANLARRGQ